MMKILAGASESEFDVDEPEEVRDHSDNKLASTAAAKTPDKSVQPAKSTARKKKKPKKILSKKKRGSKAKPQRRATKVLEVESEDDEEDEDIEEYEEKDEEDEEEEYDQRPKAKPAKKFTAKTPDKSVQPAKSTPARKKKKLKVSDDEEEILSKKKRGSKAKPPPPAPIPTSARGRGRATKVLKVYTEENLEDDEDYEDLEEEEEEWFPTAAAKTLSNRGQPAKSTLLQILSKKERAKTPGKRGQPAKSTPARKKKKPKVSDDEEEILSKKKRGSKAKPPPPAPIPTSARGQGRATKVLEVESEKEPVDDEHDEFTSGAFVVLKTDMIYEANPFIWKIDGLLQKYIPFELDGELLYKRTHFYTYWTPEVKDKYYSAPVSFINKDHIIKFYKDKIKKDPKVEEATKKEFEEEAAKLADEMEEEDDV